MNATHPIHETPLPNGSESSEEADASAASGVNPSRETGVLDLAPEPFPGIEVGTLVLPSLELVRLVDTRTLGKYRVQQNAPDGSGAVFVVTLFGATCAKVEMLAGATLTWTDYRAAIKRAIEREIGYWQNRPEPLPRGDDRTVDITVRDSDFVFS